MKTIPNMLDVKTKSSIWPGSWRVDGISTFYAKYTPEAELYGNIHMCPSSFHLPHLQVLELLKISTLVVWNTIKRRSDGRKARRMLAIAITRQDLLYTTLALRHSDLPCSAFSNKAFMADKDNLGWFPTRE